MKLKILKQTGAWSDAFFAMRKTQNPSLEFDGKEPSLVIKRRMIYSQHSPLKMVRYLVECEIPNKTQISIPNISNKRLSTR